VEKLEELKKRIHATNANQTANGIWFDAIEENW
jgi:hypothetical protein